MNDEVLNLIHERELAYKQFLRSRNPANEMRYKQLRNRVKYQIKLAKRQYFADGAKYGWKFFGTTLNLVPELANVTQNCYPGQPETVSKQKR